MRQLGGTEGSITTTPMSSYSKHGVMSKRDIPTNMEDLYRMDIPSHMDQVEYKRGAYLGYPLGARTKQFIHIDTRDNDHLSG